MMMVTVMVIGDGSDEEGLYNEQVCSNPFSFLWVRIMEVKGWVVFGWAVRGREQVGGMGFGFGCVGWFYSQQVLWNVQEDENQRPISTASSSI